VEALLTGHLNALRRYMAYCGHDLITGETVTGVEGPDQDGDELLVSRACEDFPGAGQEHFKVLTVKDGRRQCVLFVGTVQTGSDLDDPRLCLDPFNTQHPEHLFWNAYQKWRHSSEESLLEAWLMANSPVYVVYSHCHGDGALDAFMHLITSPGHSEFIQTSSTSALNELDFEFNCVVNKVDPSVDPSDRPTLLRQLSQGMCLECSDLHGSVPWPPKELSLKVASELFAVGQNGKHSLLQYPLSAVSKFLGKFPYVQGTEFYVALTTLSRLQPDMKIVDPKGGLSGEALAKRLESLTGFDDCGSIKLKAWTLWANGLTDELQAFTAHAAHMYLSRSIQTTSFELDAILEMTTPASDVSPCEPIECAKDVESAFRIYLKRLQSSWYASEATLAWAHVCEPHSIDMANEAIEMTSRMKQVPSGSSISQGMFFVEGMFVPVERNVDGTVEPTSGCAKDSVVEFILIAGDLAGYRIGADGSVLYNDSPAYMPCMARVYVGKSNAFSMPSL